MIEELKNIASASIKVNIDFFVKEFELAKWMKPVKQKSINLYRELLK